MTDEFESRIQDRPSQTFSDEEEVLEAIAEKSGMTVDELKRMRRLAGIDE